MAIQIKCPECMTSLEIAHPGPGAWVSCTSCQTVLVIKLEVRAVQKKEKQILEKPRVISDTDRAKAKETAIDLLSGWLDLAPESIREATQLLENGTAYHLFQIPKGNSGKFREISAPDEKLKMVQRRILDRFLYRIQVSNAAHGFVPSRSIVTNARYHLLNAKEVFNIDLKDAFPTVNKNWVKHLFVRHTKIPLKHMGEHVEHEVLNEVIDLLVQFTTFNNVLPQGSPTSGYLLNIACIKLDKRIYKLLSTYGLEYRYTRYADDITVSGSKEIVQELRQQIQKIVRNCGFFVNPEKLHYLQRSKGQMLEVTGLVLEKGKVRISRSRMDNYRALVHHAYALPTEQLTEAKKLELQSVIAFIAMVYGRLPSKIWIPYRKYLEKHKLPHLGEKPKPKLDMYLNKDKDPHLPPTTPQAGTPSITTPEKP